MVYKRMKQQSIAIMIQASAFSHNSCLNALNFTKTLLKQKRQISILFFHNAGASIASTLHIPLQGEANLTERWQDFIKENQLPATVCITAGLKRGILNSDESLRYKKPISNLADGFELGGLGQWVDAVNRSDKHIIFS